MSVNGREPVEKVSPVREVVPREVSVAIFRIASDAEKDCCLLEVHDVRLLHSLLETSVGDFASRKPTLIL